MNEDHNLDKFLEKYKFPLAAGLVGLVLLISGIISSGIIPKTFVKSTKSYPKESIVQGIQTQALVKVDVSGAVINPGVYSMDKEARIEDVLKAAGGASSSADPQFLTKSLNLAQKVADGMKIYVPFEGEKSSSSNNLANLVNSSSLSPENININTASLGELDKLSGVGPVTAQKIIDGRPYQGVEELITKKVLSRALYEKIKDKISTY